MFEAVVLLRATALLLVAAVLAAGAFLLLRDRRGDPPPPAPAAALVGQARADTLADVAKRIYFQEVFGSADGSAFRVMRSLPGLIRGLETGNLRLARRTLDQIPVRHAVHERITRGGRTVLDVGLKFVVAGQRHPLHAPSGRYLGRMEISVQDVIGYVRLFHRLTGGEIVVRGRRGHAKSSLPSLRHAGLPARGPATVDGSSYFVSSFARTGFAGERLFVWILNPTG
jgi:hypothetical protein